MKHIKPDETWINKKWRPAMAWMYMVVCIFDFILFPVMFTLAQMWGRVSDLEQWQPLTLMGAGLFHMAMGAVLGITAWSRGQEKITSFERTSSSERTRYDRDNDHENDYDRTNRADYRDGLSGNTSREDRP